MNNDIGMATPKDGSQGTTAVVIQEDLLEA
jgi:hypothetical protein